MSSSEDDLDAPGGGDGKSAKDGTTKKSGMSLALFLRVRQLKSVLGTFGGGRVSKILHTWSRIKSADSDAICIQPFLVPLWFALQSFDVGG